MIVDNFKEIFDMLDFSDPDTYYLVEIIKRSKDGEGKRATEIIDTIFLYENKNRLEEKIEKIKILCSTFKAKAYIYLNRRSFEKTAVNTLLQASKYLESKNFRAFLKLPYKVSGISPAEKKENKKWIVDVDDSDETNLNVYSGMVKYCLDEDKKKVVSVLKTKNGFHIITPPFNLKIFRAVEEDEGLSKITVYKESPTLLYYDDREKEKGFTAYGKREDWE